MEILNKIKNKIFLTSAVFITLLAGSFFPFTAFAQEKILSTALITILNIISVIIYALGVYLPGKLVTMLMSVLIGVAGIGGGIIQLPAVTSGWTVVLNLTNMFFVVMLLIVAFATVLRVEAYSVKKILPLLVVVAVLVNFSRIICGLAIDASQIVTKTFVDAISGSAIGSIFTLFQVNKILELQVVADDFKSATPNFEYLLAVCMAAIMLVVLTMVILVYTVVMLTRIVIFWICTILSPIAFACAVLPATKKYFQEWLEMFSRYLMVGPLCMFFLWLALYIAASATDASIVGAIGTAVGGTFDETIGNAQGGATSLTQALNAGVFANFLIATLLLMKGMELAQSLSQEFSEFTGKARDFGKWIGTGGQWRWLGKQAARVGKPVAGAAYKAGKTVGGYAGGQIVDKIYEQTGVDLNLKRVWENIQSERKAIQTERVLLGRAKAREKAERGDITSWLGASDYAYRQYFPVLGEQGFFDGIVARKMHDNKYLQDQYKQRDQIKTRVASADETYRSKIDEFAGTYKTQSEVAETKRQIDSQNKVLSQVNDGTFNASDDLSNSLLNDYLSQLEDAGDAEGANHVRNILAGVENMSGDVASGFAESLEKNLAQMHDSIPEDEEFILTDKDYQTQLSTFTSNEKTALETVQKELKKKEEYLGNWLPVIDYSGIQAQRGYMAEELKKINTDNEDDLKSLLASKMRAGDTTGVLAVTLQASKVGHLNEIMDKMGIDQSPEGMRLLFESMINDDQSKEWLAKTNKEREARGEAALELKDMGNLPPVNRQLAMSVADDASRAAKSINHWFASEMVTSENGQLKWRGSEEQATRQFNEMTKAGLNRILQQGNRLALGQHYIDKDGNSKWRLSAAGSQVIVKSMGAGMNDNLKKNLINANWVEHLNANADQIKILEDMMEEEIRKRPSEEAAIRESLRRLKTYTSKTGTSGFDPASAVRKSKQHIGSYH